MNGALFGEGAPSGALGRERLKGVGDEAHARGRRLEAPREQRAQKRTESCRIAKLQCRV